MTSICAVPWVAPAPHFAETMKQELTDALDTIDVAIRDAEVIRDMGFPVFSRGVSMKGPTKLHDGDVNVPVICGGVSVAPGDIVVGDDDGVVVIAQADAGAALGNARKRLAAEEEKRARIKAGETTADLLGVRDLLKSMGID